MYIITDFNQTALIKTAVITIKMSNHCLSRGSILNQLNTVTKFKTFNITDLRKLPKKSS